MKLPSGGCGDEEWSMKLGQLIKGFLSDGLMGRDRRSGGAGAEVGYAVIAVLK